MCLRTFDLFFHFLFFHRQQQNCRKWDFGRLEAAASGKKPKNYMFMEFGRDPVARATRPGTLMSW